MKENQVLNQDEFAINAKLGENKGFGNMSNSYSVENFEFKTGSNSTICPDNNCEFGLEDGSLWSFSTGEYSFGENNSGTRNYNRNKTPSLIDGLSVNINSIITPRGLIQIDGSSQVEEVTRKKPISFAQFARYYSCF
ncbi:MAG: hypothetical protein L0H53_16475 [Candidatus Nitrosocosmicus sp.]|nr:hypothetical protein [Candidatus Nitrosocosmicus sp.]MDN5867546.1 hypothetical protein [Candidatus Nitrosocosmicus sp.]